MQNRTYNILEKWKIFKINSKKIQYAIKNEHILEITFE